MAIVPAAGGLARRQSLEDRGAGPVDVGGEDDHAVVIELHIRQTVAEVEGHTGRDLVPVADRDTKWSHRLRDRRMLPQSRQDVRQPTPPAGLQTHLKIVFQSGKLVVRNQLRSIKTL